MVNRIELQADEVPPRAWSSAEEGSRPRSRLAGSTGSCRPAPGRTNDPGRRCYFPLGILNREFPLKMARGAIRAPRNSLSDPASGGLQANTEMLDGNLQAPGRTKASTQTTPLESALMGKADADPNLHGTISSLECPPKPFMPSGDDITKHKPAIKRPLDYRGRISRTKRTLQVLLKRGLASLQRNF